MSRTYKKPPGSTETKKKVAQGQFKPPPAIAQRSCCGSDLQRAVGLGHGITLPGGTALQTKLTLGPADDGYESEADAVAKDVVSRLAAPDTEAMEGAEGVQRQEDEELMAKRIQRQEDEELMAKRIQRQEDEEELMAKRASGVQRQDDEVMAKGDLMEGGPIGADVESSIQSARSGGTGLDEGTRSSMEGAFGADFSGVRVHNDASSDALNSSLQAKAFTTGQDIFFRQGEYSPQSSGGQELLAHELTHVVQQNGSAVQKKDDAET